MSAQYKIQENPKPGSQDNPASYHARFIPEHTVRIDQLCQEISDNSTFTSGDIKGIIQALADRIVFHLNYGSDLDIEGLGHFTASLHCIPPQEGKRFTAVNVRFKTVKFRCGKYLKEKLKTMDFKPVPKEERYGILTAERRQENIQNYLVRHEMVQSSTCMALNSCSRYMALRDLKTLIERGHIVQIGNKKSGMYKRK